MKVFVKYFSIALALFALFALSACETTEEKRKPRRQSSGGSLPWSRPAQWEGGLPGMGGLNTPNQY